MKKRIAVFANGWSNEILLQALSGMKESAALSDHDIYVFLSYATFADRKDVKRGELNIYKLSNLEDYDGVIIFSNFLNSDETAVKIAIAAQNKGIPVVSIGMDIEGTSYIGINNDIGMRALVKHLIDVHGVKRIVFIGGSRGHVDSAARLSAVRDEMESHGLKLDQEDIYFANWSNSPTVEVINETVNSEKGIPDAYVCANDIMALAACSQLFRLGFEVGKDVIVTGFDHITSGQLYFPSITTVSLNYELIGKTAVNILKERMENPKAYPEPYFIESQPVIAESCGCSGQIDYRKVRDEYCKQAYHNIINTNYIDGIERLLFIMISSATDYDSLKASLEKHYSEAHRYEGDEFYINVNRSYLEALDSEVGTAISGVYEDKIDTLISLVDGRIVQLPPADRDSIVPGYVKRDGEQKVFFFVPLHEGESNFGYTIVTDKSILLKNGYSLFYYNEKIRHAMLQLRTNLRLNAVNSELTELYDKDPMTGLFNRFCYEKKAVPLFEKSHADHTRLMIMFIDINYMKMINDRFGHIQGDNAIHKVTEAIKNSIEETWLPIRFGGDEFVVIAPDSSEEKAQNVRTSIMSYLDKVNADGERPYNISISCGFVLTDPEKQDTLQDYVKEADRLMYEIKKKRHEKDSEIKQ
ncbi:MAG: GGDEF domain-containing protein [Lachnospiraceae bacterium]|nr:GGDEF domain-containing protein [Lachnospiraceae bacterium]